MHGELRATHRDNKEFVFSKISWSFLGQIMEVIACWKAMNIALPTSEYLYLIRSIELAAID